MIIVFLFILKLFLLLLLFKVVVIIISIIIIKQANSLIFGIRRNWTVRFYVLFLDHW